jgi:hypothetical protein
MPFYGAALCDGTGTPTLNNAVGSENSAVSPVGKK